ncbi:hypothetical protein GIX45_08205 [Erwinia sp. CPCC 100877]|nr:hypothetical protein [Erwinia sp. CPCC 100877]
MRFKKSMSYQAKIILSVLVKLGLFQHSFIIYSIYQAVKKIEINLAYLYFLRFDLTKKFLHFSFYGKNYASPFEGMVYKKAISYQKKFIEEINETEIAEIKCFFTSSIYQERFEKKTRVLDLESGNYVELNLLNKRQKHLISFLLKKEGNQMLLSTPENFYYQIEIFLKNNFYHKNIDLGITQHG